MSNEDRPMKTWWIESAAVGKSWMVEGESRAKVMDSVARSCIEYLGMTYAEALKTNKVRRI